jgi:hypothetical protein
MLDDVAIIEEFIESQKAVFTEPWYAIGRIKKILAELGTTPNKQSTPCEWKCSCGQIVVGDYCKCGAYRCDL